MALNWETVGLLWLAFLSLITASSDPFQIAFQQTHLLCGQYQNLTVNNGRYTLFTNQWGADASGYQCMTVGDNQDTQSNTTAFAATWTWGQSTVTVHAYPNVNLNSALLPLPLYNLSSLEIDVAWSYNVGNDPSSSTDASSLADVGMSANVAVDMFLDPHPANATSSTKPKYEIMVWMGDYGNVHPIGFQDGVQAERDISAGNFKLYVGANNHGQMVFTWLGPKNITQFSDDISPLIRRTAFHGGPNTTDYLGVVQFGTEELHVGNESNVTFTAERVDMNIVKGIAPIDNLAIRISGAIPWMLLLVSAGISALF